MKNVTVLGGGIGGIEAAIALRKEGLDVTLVSDREYLYIWPVSIWIPTRQIEFEDVIIPLEELAKKHNFNLIIDSVKEIKTNTNSVVLENQTISYEYLVVSLGADKIKHPGIENTLSICGKPEDSLKLREKLDTLISQGEGKIAIGFGGNPKDPSATRGGPAYEVIFNIDHYLRRKGLRDNFELTFFAPMTNPGARMGENALVTMNQFFKRTNINTHFGKKIKEFSQDGIIFEDETKLDSDLTMFISAGTVKEELRNSDLPLTEAGFIKIDEHCQVEGLNNVYAIGDIANLEGPQWRSKQGHVAEVMARVTAQNIKASIQGSPKRHGYKEHLNILCIMDTGNGATYIYRDDHKERLVPLPVIGGWLKRGWRQYYRLSKLKKIPRIPGM